MNLHSTYNRTGCTNAFHPLTSDTARTKAHPTVDCATSFRRLFLVLDDARNIADAYYSGHRRS
jgi:hypothetical protein